MNLKSLFFIFFIAALLFLSPAALNAQQDNQPFTLTADNLEKSKTIDLEKAGWKFRLGDDSDWAARELNEADWQPTTETKIKEETLFSPDWKGRAWFRLHLNVDQSLAERRLIFVGRQSAASEIYLDGKKLDEFGRIGENGEVSEYNPNGLPVPFKFETPGEHTIAIRFASKLFADTSSLKTRWLINGGLAPYFSLMVRDGTDLSTNINSYANGTSMRIGFLFVGFLTALGILHFLLYLFYRAERANLFYSIYAISYAIFILFNNLSFNGHSSGDAVLFLRLFSSLANAFMYTGLLAFVHVAFGKPLGKIFWGMAAGWAIYMIVGTILLTKVGWFSIAAYVLIALTFAFCIMQLFEALREKRSGARILLVGLQVLALAMVGLLIRQFYQNNVFGDFVLINEFALILAVPLAVSIFLARNFARTNRDLLTQLHQVETLSAQKIEQERQSAELRAENERRAKELEEARQLQLSMLPKKLPVIPNLEIAAYMKPATEVGGDYYDFHVGKDGTLTVAVGDATGHGLKAGSVVTATKSLFNAFAEQENIPHILSQTNGALKKMNLRGLFMAMAMLKVKDSEMTLSIAGMPAVLIYRKATNQSEEFALRALPLGSIARSNYQEREISLAAGDVIVLMSDGFPELFNESGEMLGFEKTAEVLPAIAHHTPQEIIDQLINIGDNWAGTRPPDDDITFVVLKVSNNENEN